MNEENFPPLPEYVSQALAYTICAAWEKQMYEYGRIVAEECAKICDENPDDGAYHIREKFGVKT